jgi:hypothetical protein
MQSRRYDQSADVLSERRLGHRDHFEPFAGTVQDKLHRKVHSIKESKTVNFRLTIKPHLDLDRRKSPFNLLKREYDQVLAFASRLNLQFDSV